MDLNTLPSEILHQVLTHVVKGLSFNELADFLRLQLVNKRFAAEIRQALFLTRALDHYSVYARNTPFWRDYLTFRATIGSSGAVDNVLTRGSHVPQGSCSPSGRRATYLSYIEEAARNLAKFSHLDKDQDPVALRQLISEICELVLVHKGVGCPDLLSNVTTECRTTNTDALSLHLADVSKTFLQPFPHDHSKELMFVAASYLGYASVVPIMYQHTRHTGPTAEKILFGEYYLASAPRLAALNGQIAVVESILKHARRGPQLQNANEQIYLGAVVGGHVDIYTYARKSLRSYPATFFAQMIETALQVGTANPTILSYLLSDYEKFCSRITTSGAKDKHKSISDSTIIAALIHGCRNNHHESVRLLIPKVEWCTNRKHVHHCKTGLKNNGILDNASTHALNEITQMLCVVYQQKLGQKKFSRQLSKTEILAKTVGKGHMATAQILLKHISDSDMAWALSYPDKATGSPLLAAVNASHMRLYELLRSREAYFAKRLHGELGLLHAVCHSDRVWIRTLLRDGVIPDHFVIDAAEHVGDKEIQEMVKSSHKSSLRGRLDWIKKVSFGICGLGVRVNQPLSESNDSYHGLDGGIKVRSDVAG